MHRFVQRLAFGAFVFCLLPVNLAHAVQAASKTPAASKADGTVENDAAIETLLAKLLKETNQPTIDANDKSANPSKKLQTPVPGLIAGFQTAGKPPRIAAVGTRKWDTEIGFTPNDKVHLGSCTKAITATMIGRLVDQKKLSFNMTIAEGLPHIKDQIHADYHGVTLRQLLMHCGGVAREGFWGIASGDPVAKRRVKIVVRALKEKPKMKPGSNFAYSNLGYCVAAMFAEHREGLSWEELIQREIFGPLKLTSAGFGPPSVDDKEDQPWGHLFINNQVYAQQRDNPATLGPAGTIHMTIADWAKFALVHADPDSGKFLSAKTMAVLHELPSKKELSVPSFSTKYACGWLVMNRNWSQGRVLYHNGSNTMWMCVLRVAPKTKTVYMAAANLGNSDYIGSFLDKAIGGVIEIEQSSNKDRK